MFIDTLRGYIHLTGFPSLSAPMNYQYTMPVTLNGSPPPHTVTGRSCKAASGLGVAADPAHPSAAAEATPQ